MAPVRHTTVFYDTADNNNNNNKKNMIKRDKERTRGLAKLFLISDPPPKPSLKLIIARGPLNMTFPAIVFWHDLAWNQHEDCF